MFEETADCTRFNVETRIIFCIDKAAIDWEKEHIENLFLEKVKKVFGEKCVQACKTLDLLKKKVEEQNNDSWLSKIFSFIFTSGVIGGLIRGTMLNPAIGAGVTAPGLVGGLVWKGILNDFKVVREKTFNEKLNDLSNDKIKRIFRKRYEQVIKKSINIVIKRTLPQYIKDLHEDKSTWTDKLCSNEEDLSIVGSLSDAITELKTTLDDIEKLHIH